MRRSIEEIKQDILKEKAKFINLLLDEVRKHINIYNKCISSSSQPAERTNRMFSQQDTRKEKVIEHLQIMKEIYTEATSINTDWDFEFPDFHPSRNRYLTTNDGLNRLSNELKKAEATGYLDNHKIQTAVIVAIGLAILAAVLITVALLVNFHSVWIYSAAYYKISILVSGSILGAASLLTLAIHSATNPEPIFKKKDDNDYGYADIRLQSEDDRKLLLDEITEENKRAVNEMNNILLNQSAPSSTTLSWV
ncbi:MAG: hypothetical protein P1U74_10540 [Legionellaceae bacterium]|nr:hypothetical protein [Legionellaceae bacterium]